MPTAAGTVSKRIQMDLPMLPAPSANGNYNVRPGHAASLGRKWRPWYQTVVAVIDRPTFGIQHRYQTVLSVVRDGWRGTVAIGHRHQSVF